MQELLLNRNTGLIDRTKPRVSMDKSSDFEQSAELSLDQLVQNQEKLLINSAKSIYSFLIDQSQSQTGELSSFWIVTGKP